MLEQYDIRFCRGDEAPKLRDFIGAHWKSGHVLALSQEPRGSATTSHSRGRGRAMRPRISPVALLKTRDPYP